MSRDHDKLPEALRPFSRALAIHDALPARFKPSDETPLREILAGIWPTVADLRALVEWAASNRGNASWQPIETAPKNTKLLVAYQNELGNWRIVTACYHTRLEWSDEYGDHEEEFAPEAWYEENDSSEVIYPTSRVPTHWQPLPATPAAKGPEHG